MMLCFYLAKLEFLGRHKNEQFEQMGIGPFLQRHKWKKVYNLYSLDAIHNEIITIEHEETQVPKKWYIIIVAVV